MNTLQTFRIFVTHRLFFALAAVGLLCTCLSQPVQAVSCATNPDQQSCSSSYGISESFFGSGGQDTCPTVGGNAYCAKQSAGELTVGNTKSTQYQAQAGFNTDRTEWIECAIVGADAVDLGVLDTGTAHSGSVQFRVKSYLSSGYVVQFAGTPPAYAGHTLTAMTNAASAPGTEQFGINLVANTTPAVGAAPVQHTDTAHSGEPFGFGQVAAGYNTANTFTFSPGATIASSSSSSGYTTYTISYIANISPVPPAGTYVGYNSVVATATF